MKPHKAAALSGENIPKHGMKCIMRTMQYSGNKTTTKLYWSNHKD